VFKLAEECSKIVQTKGITAVDAKRAAETTANLLQKLCIDIKFDMFYDQCVQDAEQLGIDEPCIRRKVCRPKRFESGGEQYHPETARDQFHQVYNEFIDTIVVCIKQRFDNPSYALFSQIVCGAAECK